MAAKARLVIFVADQPLCNAKAHQRATSSNMGISARVMELLVNKGGQRQAVFKTAVKLAARKHGIGANLSSWKRQLDGR